MNLTTIVILIACFGSAGLICSMGKENKIFYWASAFFALVGVFFLSKELTGDLLSTPWINYGFRGIAVCVLLVFCYFYYKERNKSGGEK